MTVAMSLEQRRLDRAEQVEHLRRKIAAVSGKVGDGRRGPAPSIDPLPDSESLLPLPESFLRGVVSPGRTAADVVAARDGGGAVGRPVAVAEHGGGGDGGGRARRDRRPARRRPAGGRRNGSGSEQDRGHPRTRCRSGRGGRGADGWHGPGGARPGWAVGACRPGAGGGGPGAAEGLHPAGHRWRLARGVHPAGGQGLWL